MVAREISFHKDAGQTSGNERNATSSAAERVKLRLSLKGKRRSGSEGERPQLGRGKREVRWRKRRDGNSKEKENARITSR